MLYVLSFFPSHFGLGINRILMKNHVSRLLHYAAFSFLLLMLFSVSSCGGEKNAAEFTGQIDELEASMQKWPSTETASKLIDLYQQYANEQADNAKSADKVAEALYRKARYQLYLKRPAAATKTLRYALWHYRNAPSAYNMALLLGEIWKTKPEKQAGTQALYSLLPEAFPDYAGEAKHLKDSLGMPTIASVPQLLDSLKLALYNSPEPRPDRSIGVRFMDVADAYALLMPSAKDAPAYLFDAAKVAGYLGDFSRSIDLYQTVYEQFPDFEKAAQAIFMLGFVYDNDLKDFDKARTYYELYLKKYPEGAFAEQVQFLLENLGKSPEELLQELEAKQQGK